MECLKDSYGNKHCIPDKGIVVLYFYPKDNTPGCTTEAKEFSLLKKEFEKLGAKVYGVSPDTCESHKRFVSNHNLSITLLSDPEKKLIKKFKVWKKKKRFGREYYGVERSTFIILDGRVVKEWRGVKAEGHAKQVLKWLRENIKSLSKK